MDVRAALKGQYHAAVAMLRGAIDACPDALWTADGEGNATWRIAYHAVFYGHLYLMPSEAEFRPWAGHRPDHQFLGPLPWPPHDLPRIGPPYQRADLLGYCDLLDGLIDPAIDRTDLAAPLSGFPWYPIPKLEHLMLGVRHVQHHAGQIADRLRRAAGRGVAWVASAGRRA